MSDHKEFSLPIEQFLLHSSINFIGFERMSNQNSILAIVVAIVVVLGGGWYLVQHERTIDPVSAEAVNQSLTIDMPPLLVPESKKGRVVNIALLTIGIVVSSREAADRVRTAVPELRSQYKADLEEYLTDRPDTSLEQRIADFSTYIAAVNGRVLGEGTVIELVVDEPTAKPNDYKVESGSD
jgi:hypothetical protein